MTPQHQADCRAGLGVSRFVRQVIVSGEAFIAAGGAQPARDKQAGRHEVLPQSLKRRKQAGIAALRRDIRRAGVEIHGPYCMPNDLGLLTQRLVGLKVFVGLCPIRPRIVAAGLGLHLVVMRLPSPRVDEVLGQGKVPRLAGRPGELDQGQFDLLVPAIPAPLTWPPPEHRGDVVCLAGHDVEQTALAGRLKVGDGSFHQMPGAIHLVRVAQVGPALARIDALEVTVDIPAWVLQPGVPGNDGVEIGLQRGIGMGRQRQAGRLDPFGVVGIPEMVRAVGHAEAPVQVQRVEPAGLGQHLAHMRNRDIAVELKARRPE